MSNRESLELVIRLQAFSYDFNLRSTPWPSRKLVPAKRYMFISVYLRVYTKSLFYLTTVGCHFLSAHLSY
jgi:hypothetical protein